MAALQLTKEGPVFILTMINGEADNCFTLDVINEYDALLDEVENSKENAALILTSNHPKTWCNGLDREWLFSHPDTAQSFISAYENLMVRMALLNLPTLACITGNCYAGGAIMASAMDTRLMRQDRGRFCFPEVDIRIPFTLKLTAVINLLPNKQALSELALTGRAMGGEECLPKQIVDAIYPENELRIKALERANFLATKDRHTYTVIKHELRKDLVALRGLSH